MRLLDSVPKTSPCMLASWVCASACIRVSSSLMPSKKSAPSGLQISQTQSAADYQQTNLQKGCILYQSYYRRPKMNSKRVLLPKIVRSHVCRFSQISADSEQNHARKVIIWNQSALLCTSCWLLKKLNRNRFRGGLMTITKCAMKQSLHRSLEEICYRIVN